MNCSKTNNSIPFRVTLSLPQFLVSLIRLNLTVFACRRIRVTLTPPSFFASYIFFLSFSVIRNLHKLCLSLRCVCLCPSSVTTGEGTEARPLPDFGTYSGSPIPLQLPSDKPILVTIPHPHKHTPRWESEREIAWGCSCTRREAFRSISFKIIQAWVAYGNKNHPTLVSLKPRK